MCQTKIEFTGYYATSDWGNTLRYFVKETAQDQTFYSMLRAEEVREHVLQGRISLDWLITSNPFGESYVHFIRLPKTPANWVAVGDFLANPTAEQFETGFIPPATGYKRPSIWSFRERISRDMFWLVTLASGFASLVMLWLLWLLLLLFDSHIPSYISILAAPFLVSALFMGAWVGLAAQVKRWHDRGKSGWMALVFLIPVIGWIWVPVELGFLPGTKWDNRYGGDPEI